MPIQSRQSPPSVTSTGKFNNSRTEHQPERQPFY